MGQEGETDRGRQHKLETTSRNHLLFQQYQYESCKLRGQRKIAVKKKKKKHQQALELKILTQAGVGPALAEIGRFHQEHAGLMSHPRTENQQQSSQDNATLKREKRGEETSARWKVSHSAQPYCRPLPPLGSLTYFQPHFCLLREFPRLQSSQEKHDVQAQFYSPQPKDNAEQPPVSHSFQLHQFKHRRVNWEPFVEQNFHSSPHSFPQCSPQLSAASHRAKKDHS